MKRLLTNNKAIELSINMLVVIILGIVILIAGISIFYNAYGKVSNFNDQVDAQTQTRLNALLDDGAPIVVLMSTQDGERGKPVTFNVAVNNYLQSTKSFIVHVSYATTTANYEGSIPFKPSTAIGGDTCHTQGGQTPDTCGNLWILGGERTFTLKNNERELFPVRVTIPKKNIAKGQYIFNIDVCYVDEGETPSCNKDAGGNLLNRFSSRQKLYVTIN